MLPTPCPAPAKLEALVLGHLSGTDADAAEHHVATCQRCIDTLQSMGSEDELSRALRRPLYALSGPGRGAVSEMMPALKLLRPKDATGTWTRPDDDSTRPQLSVPQPSFSTTEVFTFLSPPAAPDEIGRLGPYRVLGVLGTGGMGVVFRAEDPHLKRFVALKVVKPQALASPEARARFVEEARALAQLEHDHIVTAYHAGEDNGVPFLAMPLLAGRALKDRLEEAGGPIGVDEILYIGREIATGLAVAHARGFVHRDIKPGNVWLESRDGGAPRVKILDFGLAEALSAGGSMRAGGTPAYMAPEQAAGGAVDGRADLFSLGCVLYQMAAGRVPFTGDTLLSLMMSVALDQPPPIRGVNPTLPAALDELIGRLLSKAREGRPGSAAATVTALLVIEESRRPKPSRRKWLLGTAGAVLGAAGLAGIGVRRFFLPPESPLPEPGELTFEYDEPDGRVVLRRDDEDRTVNVASERTIALPPGEYTLRPASGKRTLWPGSVVVGSGEKKIVTLRLIGEIAMHREHAFPVGGLVPVARKGEVLIVSVGHDRTLVAWTPGSKEKAKVLWHRDSPLRCVAVSPDGRTAATGCGDTGPRAVQAVRFWDLEKLDRLPGEATCGSQVNAVVFAPAPDRLVWGENDGTLVYWDARLSVALAEVAKAHGGLGVFAIAFLPEGKRVLTAGGDGAIVERAVADLEPVRTLTGHTKPVRGLAVLAGGQQVASAGDGAAIRIWTLATGKARTWDAPTDILTLAASADGTRLLTGDAGGAVRLWDVAGGRELVRFDGHTKAVTAIAFTPDGRRAASGGEDGTVRLWELPE